MKGGLKARGNLALSHNTNSLPSIHRHNNVKSNYFNLNSIGMEAGFSRSKNRESVRSSQKDEVLSNPENHEQDVYKANQLSPETNTADDETHENEGTQENEVTSKSHPDNENQGEGNQVKKPPKLTPLIIKDAKKGKFGLEIKKL